jgi:ABC-type glycerol-3-phosphate transport system permease component
VVDVDRRRAIVVFCLFPFYWLINISLKTGNDLQSSSLIPPHPTLDNYQAIFKNPTSRRRCATARSSR